MLINQILYTLVFRSSFIIGTVIGLSHCLKWYIYERWVIRELPFHTELHYLSIAGCQRHLHSYQWPNQTSHFPLPVKLLPQQSPDKDITVQCNKIYAMIKFYPIQLLSSKLRNQLLKDWNHEEVYRINISNGPFG